MATAICVPCGFAAWELGEKEIAHRQCKDWEGCCHRRYPGDKDIGRCHCCGVEFEIAASAFDEWCNGCTNYGVF